MSIDPEPRKSVKSSVDVDINFTVWQNHEVIGLCSNLVENTLNHIFKNESCSTSFSVSIQLSNDKTLRHLNNLYRKKDNKANIM